MAHFSIISSQSGQTIFEGAPRYVGAYLKPGYLEFGQIGSPTPINWHVGDYVAYSRTGKTYRLYRTPQTVEQGARNRYGASFLYENVQFFDDSKQLEFCPFTDLVPGDNTIHFSTQNTVSFFGKPLNVAERLQACLEAQYGSGSWEIRIVTTTDADLLELLDTEVEFAVAGVNCLEVLDKVYETWNGLGWIHTVESGVNVITIGASNVRTSANTTVPFAYDDGLVRVEKSIANADQIGTRLFAYGSMKNMDATYYRGLDIYNAESVDIEHLMIPLAYWGRTSNKPDARKAYIENAEAIAQLGLIPRTAYFDGSGDLPDIHPTIERMTIGEVYDAGGAGYLPNLSKWSRSQRIDEVVAATNPDDHGTSAEQGQKYAETISGTLVSVSETFVDHDYFNATIFSGTLQHSGKLTLKFGRNRQVFTLGSVWSPIFNLNLSVTAGEKTQAFPLDVVRVSSTSYYCVLPDSIVVSGTTAGSLTVSVTGYIGEEEDASAPGGEGVFSTDVTTTVGGGLEYELSKTFSVTIPQIGFDIDNYADLGNGKTISMKTGMCAGRDFEVKDATYISSDDSWVLTLYRSIDEDLNIMFPNADYEIAAGDQYVLLDIAMPEMYVTVASQRLFSAAMTLLADISVEQPFYAPQIDAKVVYNESRVLRDGMWMDISLDGDRQFVIIDSITIDENGSNIPTYEVALRETKGLEWTENVGRASSSRSSTSVSGSDAQQSSSSVDLSNYYTKPETDTEISTAISALNLGAAATYGIGSVASGNTGLVTGGAVWSAIDALPEPMVFKGSLGTGGTITSLPAASAANEGFTYKVITAGTYRGTAAKVGDTFISNGSSWVLIPSGDEPDGTVTSVGLTMPTGFSVASSPITTSGTLAVTFASGYSLPTTAKQNAWDAKYDKPSTGIPQTDLASALSTKVDNGSTAYGYFSNGVLPYNHGGTGISSYTKGNIIYASANNTLAKLAPNTGTKQFLTMTSSVPSWGGVDETDVFGSSAIGSSSLPVYYTGSALATITSLDLLSKNTGYIKGNRFYLTSDIYFYTESVDGTTCVRLNAPFITSGDQIVISGTPGGGGGGGGATTLAGLDDTNITNPQAGQILSWNGTKWVNTNAPTGSITSVSLAAGATNGTLHLVVNGTAQSDVAVTGLGSLAYKSSLAFSELSSHPTNLSGYGITDAKIANGVITLGGNTITPLTSHQTVTLASGTNNGTLKLTVGSTTTDNIAVKGLGSMAYETASNYVTTSSGYYDTVLANNAALDADALTSERVHYTTAGDIGSSSGGWSNFPTGVPSGSFGLLTLKEGGYPIQLFHSYYSNDLWFRYQYYLNGTGKTWVDWKRIWNEGNDGASSGLDADLLDGQHGSYYATASSVSTLQGYFTNGVANSAAKLTTVSKTIWGQTYWTSGGIPQDVTAAPNLYIGTTKVQVSSAAQALTGITSITASGLIKTTNYVQATRFYLTDSIYFEYNSTHGYVTLNAPFVTSGDQIVISGTPGGGGGGGATTLAGLDDVAITSIANGQLLQYNGSKWVNVAASSVGRIYSAGTGISISNANVISLDSSEYYSATISRTANTVLAAPNGSNGAAGFRTLVAADIPSLTKSKISDFPTNVSAFTNDAGYITSYTDTKNTTGADNTTSKIFLVGPTAQTTSNGSARTYSNSNCYASGGYLYSGGSQVLTSHQTLYNLVINNSAGTAQITYKPGTSGTYALTLTKAMVGLGSVENTALSTWAGTTNITTLGTITSGTWNGSAIAWSKLSISAQNLYDTIGSTKYAPYNSAGYLPLTGGVIQSASSYARLRLVTTSAEAYVQAGTSSGNAGTLYLTGYNASTGSTLALQFSNVYAWNGSSFSQILHAGNYSSYALPLTGGTMSNTNLVTNLNADYVDGYSYSDIVASPMTPASISDMNNVVPFRYFIATSPTNKPDTNSTYVVGFGLAFNNDQNYKIALAYDMTSSHWFSRSQGGGNWGSWNKIAYLTDNVASATYATSAGDSNTLDGIDSTGFFRRYTLANSGQSYDANNYTQNDTHYLVTGDRSSVQAWNNFPETNTSGGFGLLYLQEGNYPIQLFHNYYSPSTWFRYKYYQNGVGATWSSWLKMYNSGNSNLSTVAWACSNLTASGTITSTGDQVVSSDITLKTNLKDVTYSVSDIAKARAVEFDWRDGRGHSMGSIAQDWLGIAPALVHGKEGNMSLAYGQLALVNTILLARQSESHEERIARLEARVAELEMENERLRMN